MAIELRNGRERVTHDEKRLRGTGTFASFVTSRVLIKIHVVLLQATSVTSRSDIRRQQASGL